MQTIKPTTRGLIAFFAERDADFTTGFRAELAGFIRVMWRLYGHQPVHEQTITRMKYYRRHITKHWNDGRPVL